MSTPEDTLVERLSARKSFFQNGAAWLMSPHPDATCTEAAAEITRLRAELAAAVKRADECSAETVKVQDDLGRLLHAAEKEAAALAADQCHAGYGDEYGNHRCKYQDALATERADKERMQEALKAEVERLKAIRDVRRYGEGHAVISNIRAALSQAKGGADMKEVEAAALADQIETRARDVTAPPFDDLIEENWKVIVAALRARAALAAAERVRGDGWRTIDSAPKEGT